MNGAGPEHLTPAAAEKQLAALRSTKRTRERDQKVLTEFKHEIENLKYKIAGAEKELEAVKSIIIEKCIGRRNETATKCLQRDFINKRKQISRNGPAQAQGDIENTLKVFCVSSVGYLALHQKKTYPGFSTCASTGIPQLHTWLLDSTMAAREAEADTLLEKMESLQETMHMWAYDSAIDMKILPDMRAIVESLAEQEIMVLQDVCFSFSGTSL